MNLDKFLDSLVLVEAYGDTPEVTASDSPRIEKAVIDLITSIQAVQGGVSKKMSAQDRKNNEDYIKVIKYIQKYPDVVDRLGFMDEAWEHHCMVAEHHTGKYTWSLNSKLQVKESLMYLYLHLRDFPQRFEDWEIAEQFTDGKTEPLISAEAQASIVLEIYKYTDFETTKNQKYNDKEYHTTYEKKNTNGEIRYINDALDNISRERQRIFEVFPKNS